MFSSSGRPQRGTGAVVESSVQAPGGLAVTPWPVCHLLGGPGSSYLNTLRPVFLECKMGIV